ncbi:MAG: hypothetical protein AAF191_20865, partial [Verrucomicrobiota bacterium]
MTPFASLLASSVPELMLDGGTGLRWAGIGHLTFGTACLSIFEAFLLQRFFGADKDRTFLLVLGGNFLSAWLAALLLGNVASAPHHLKLDTAWTWFWGASFLCLLLMIIVEWAFVYWSLPQQGARRAETSLRANLLIQPLSLVLLALYYVGPSQVSLYTQLEQVPLRELPVPDQLRVYYTSLDQKTVYSTPLATFQPSLISNLESESSTERSIRQLLLRPQDETSPSQEGAWDLLALLQSPRARPSMTAMPLMIPVAPSLIGLGTLQSPHRRRVERGKTPRWVHPSTTIG